MTPDKPAATGQSNTGAKVSEKSTKPELWAAYNELLRQLEGRPAEPVNPEVQAALAGDPARSLAELKLKVGQQLDALGADVQGDLESLQDLRRQIQLERRRLLEAQRGEQQQLADAIASVRRQWQDEQAEREREQKQLQAERQKERQREEEDFRYSLTKTRRAEEDKYQEQRTARENALQQREQALKDQAEHVAQVEADLAAWPKRLDDAVTQARATLTKELAAAHSAELREAKLIHQHELSLASLKAQALEQTLKGQTAEIESLKRQLISAQTQLKDMAVVVIEGRSSDVRPAASKPVSEVPAEAR